VLDEVALEPVVDDVEPLLAVHLPARVYQLQVPYRPRLLVVIEGGETVALRETPFPSPVVLVPSLPKILLSIFPHLLLLLLLFILSQLLPEHFEVIVKRLITTTAYAIITRLLLLLRSRQARVREVVSSIGFADHLKFLGVVDMGG
jgi:hypothetical protein